MKITTPASLVFSVIIVSVFLSYVEATPDYLTVPNRPNVLESAERPTPYQGDRDNNGPAWGGHIELVGEKPSRFEGGPGQFVNDRTGEPMGSHNGQTWGGDNQDGGRPGPRGGPAGAAAMSGPGENRGENPCMADGPCSAGKSNGRINFDHGQEGDTRIVDNGGYSNRPEPLLYR